MPWTLAHPAAVLPLRRRHGWLPFLGLVIGSLSPDFGYHSGHFDAAKVAHSLPGLFVVCLPTGLAAAMLLLLFKPVLVELLPQPHRHALSTLGGARRWPGARELLALAAAVVVGAATHVVWDSFTHGYGLPVQHLPFMRALLVRVGEHDFRVYNTLQHASTVVGVTCLLVAYRRWLRRAPAAPAGADDGLDRARVLLLLACLGAAVAVAIPLAHAAAAESGSERLVSVIVVRTVIYATTFATLLYLAAALAWAARRRRA
ncbi:MAG: DUF4184 family protein [Burkholderiales bacterium]|nr:DUF4184 family protein [Burkholderiales bacterium]